MPFSAAEQDIITRLTTYWDGDFPYDPTTNPGGLRLGGQRVNFESILKDIGNIANGTGRVTKEATDTVNAALALYGSIAAVAQAVVDAQSARDAAQGFRDTASGQATASFNSATLSQAWAVQLATEVVAGQGFSARYYAISASGSATLADTRAAAAAASATSAANVAPNRTYAALIADLSPAEGTVRQVLVDPNAGTYVKVGASNAGSWSYAGPTVPGLDTRLKRVEPLAGAFLDHPTIALSGYGDLIAVNLDSSDRPYAFTTASGQYYLNAAGAWEREIRFTSDVNANALVFQPGTPIPVEFPPIGIFSVGDAAEIRLDSSDRPYFVVTTSGEQWAPNRVTAVWERLPKVDYNIGRLASDTCIVDAGFGGTVIATDAAIGTGALQYGGDFYRGCLWLRNPARQGDGTVIAEVNWDRRGQAWEAITLNAGGVALTADIASRIVVVMPSYGQSLSIGGNSVGTSVVTTSAVDPGVALMPSLNGGGAHPYVGRRGILGSRDLQHAIVQGSSGETHLAGMVRAFSTRCTAQGAKLKTYSFTCGSGGHGLAMLGPTWTDWALKSRGGIWDDLLRTTKAVFRQIEAQGLIPVLAPIVFIHGEEDSGLFPGMAAAEYIGGMRELLNRLNAALKRELGWHDQAPPIGMILGQTATHGPRMNPTARKFARGNDGPRVAQWVLPRVHDGFVRVVPSHDYDDADGTHLKSPPYYCYGERIGRDLFDYSFGKFRKPVEPIGIVRNSSTQFDLTFSLPDANTLTLDTVTVAPALDAAMGFVMWNANTGSSVAISNVAINAYNVVRIDHTAVSGAEYWLDYALWNDPGGPSRRAIGRTGENGGLAGVRGNLRTDAAFASTITDYGQPAWTDYEWAPGFRTLVCATSGAYQPVTGQI